MVVLSRTYECFSTNLLYILMWKLLVLTKIVLILQLEIQIVIDNYEFWQSTPPMFKISQPLSLE